MILSNTVKVQVCKKHEFFFTKCRVFSCALISNRSTLNYEYIVRPVCNVRVLLSTEPR